MKVRTNLTPRELITTGRGLTALGKSQQHVRVFPTENNAERELLRQSNHTLDVMLESLQHELAAILLD